MNSHQRRVARREDERWQAAMRQLYEVDWAMPFRSLPFPCPPDNISCRSIIVLGQPFVEFAAADGRGGFEEFRPLTGVARPSFSASEFVEAVNADRASRGPRRVGQARATLHIDPSAFVESLNRMVDGMGDELRAVAGRAVQDRIEAMHRGAPFGLLEPRRSGIVAAFEHRYQRKATDSERATLLGRSPRELEAMRQALLPVEDYPAEQRVDPQQQQRLKAAEVEALISEFEPEI